MQPDQESLRTRFQGFRLKPARTLWQGTLALFLPRALPETLNKHLLLLMALRRRRDALLGRELFSDPAWELLLALCAANETGRTIAFADLAARVGLSGTASAAWLGRLAERGLVSYRTEPGSSKTSVALSRRGERLMQQILDC